jgi:hypothetical protein
MISRKHWSPGSDVSVQSVERRDSGGWTVSGSLTPNVGSRPIDFMWLA